MTRCEKCGEVDDAVHDSLGGQMRCIREQAERIASPELLEKVDALEGFNAEKRNEALRHAEVLPPEEMPS